MHGAAVGWGSKMMISHPLNSAMSIETAFKSNAGM
jgi:hypothetical protein